MGWDQNYWKDYQITFLKTIHGSKSELKRSRYPENREKQVSMLLDAITFDSIVIFSISLVLWILDINSFPGTLRLAQSKSGKTFKYIFKTEPGKSRNC